MVTIAGRQKMRPLYLICLSSLMLVFLLVLHITPVYAETYTYDTAGRLTKVAYNDGSTITYSYDNTGNLLQRVVTVNMTMADVIRILQVFTQIDPSAPVYKKLDVDGDGQIELEEVIYILQKVSELRQ